MLLLKIFLWFISKLSIKVFPIEMLLGKLLSVKWVEEFSNYVSGLNFSPSNGKFNLNLVG